MLHNYRLPQKPGQQHRKKLEHWQCEARRCEYFTLAESLGGVKALLCHPATMTHASIPPEARAELGLSDTLIRLSPGCENSQDLVDDLLEGLAELETVRASQKRVPANAR